MKKLFGGSCYGYCLAWLYGEKSGVKYLTTMFLNGWSKGFIDMDGYVSKPLSYIEMMSGVSLRDIEKVTINTENDIPITPTIVEMECPAGGSHFVVCHRLIDGKLVLDFDPSGISNSWKAQKFISYRRFIK